VEIKAKYPEAWAYFKALMKYREEKGFNEALAPSLPRFDDNDEWIKEE
jgi:hypothetical protein